MAIVNAIHITDPMTVILKISGSLQRTGILVCLGGILGQVGAAAEEPAREPLADARVGDVNPGGFGRFQRLGALFWESFLFYAATPVTYCKEPPHFDASQF